jgi:hypothetical protein
VPLAPVIAWPAAAAARILIWYGTPILYDAIQGLTDSSHEESDETRLEWRRLVIGWTRPAPTGLIEDKAHITFDIANITGGDLDPSWTTADYTACETFFDEWANVVKTYQADSHTLKEYRWYEMRFRQTQTSTHRFATTGPPLRTTAKTITGASTALELPYQVAMSVTERTGVPKHWGRFYLPGITGAMIQQGAAAGRWDPALTAAIGNATAELYQDLEGADFMPIVPVTQINKVFAKALLRVNQVVVDDIPDVIRRRRPRQVAARHIGVPA